MLIYYDDINVTEQESESACIANNEIQSPVQLETCPLGGDYLHNRL